ncbi:MAG TPA: DUF192 domain-containing protein [Thermoanaerobaculia bacterium]|nr:DUF192 domain-containing protein [Thermoanaerobaculia bacterium]
MTVGARCRRAQVAVVVIALIASCAQPAPSPASDPQSPVPRVIFPDGYQVRVELATDPATRAQGLMFRDRLREHTGMLFFFPGTAVQSFWMKNTLIPLDIIWIDEQQRIVHLKHDVPPCRADPCPSHDPGVPARYVLEVAAGVARQHGLGEGDILRFEGVENVVVR